MPVKVEVCGKARQAIVATCADIGENGLRLRLEDKLSSGTDLKLCLCVYHHQFEVFAQVAWCRPAGTSGFEAGLKVLDGTDALRARIDAQLRAVRELIDRRHRDGIELTFDQACREWIERHLDDFPQELQSMAIG